MQPLPPSPALTWISAVSMNKETVSCQPSAESGRRELRPDRLHGDEPAIASAVPEPHDARDARVERVVLAPSHVDARVEARASLPDEDRAARHDLPREALYAESLRVRVAPVAG